MFATLSISHTHTNRERENQNFWQFIALSSYDFANFDMFRSFEPKSDVSTNFAASNELVPFQLLLACVKV